MKVEPTAAPASITPKQEADSPPTPKSNDERLLLRRIIAESKRFRGAARQNDR